MAAKDRTTAHSEHKLADIGRSVVNLLFGPGLSQRISCTLIFVCFTLVYVMFLTPATRTSEIIYPGVSIQMESVPDAAKAQMPLGPGEEIAQTIIGTGDEIDSVSVQIAFDARETDGMYEIELRDEAGALIGEYSFTAAGHTSPFSAALPVGGYKTEPGQQMRLVLRSAAENTDVVKTTVVPFDSWFSHDGLAREGVAEESVLLVSVITRVSKAPAWTLALILIACVSPAMMCWRAPLAINALVLILIFGCLFVFLTPINDSPDEIVHMARTFHMADGYWLDVPIQEEPTAEGLELYSGSIGQTMSTTGLSALAWGSKPPLGEMGSDLLFLGYIPQTLGVWFGRLFGMNLAGIYYMGRLFNLLFYAACAFIGVRMAPRFRLFLAVFAIMPMQLAICATYNSDGLLYGLSILAASWFVRMYYDRAFYVTARDLLLFMIPCVLIGIKQYWVAPIAFLPFVLPRERFAKLQTKWWCVVVAAGTIAATVVSLSLSVSGLLTGNAGGASGEGASVPEQLAYVASAPYAAMRVLASSLAAGLGDNLAQLFVFGRLTAQAPALIGMIYVGFIAVVAFSTTRYQYDPAFTVGNTPSRTATRVGVLIVCSATLVAIYFATYLTWTPVGVNVVMGVQGRYLIPVMAYLPFLSFDCWPLVTRGVYMRSRLVTGLIAVLMLTASMMTISFYTL